MASLKNGSNIINLDKIEMDTKYTFTLNPVDSLQYWDQANRIECVNRDTALLVNKLSQDDTVNFELNMETSSVGRLHYHGTISFDTFGSALNFYVFGINTLLKKYHIEIDEINDEEIWAKYCDKQNTYFCCAEKDYYINNNVANTMVKKIVHQNDSSKNQLEKKITKYLYDS